MAGLEKVPVQDNGAATLLASIFQNSNTLFGSGESTTRETADPAALAQSNNLISQILAGNNSADIDNMIKGILDKAKVAFGPNIANSLASGNRALTDTTLSDLQSRAQGYATTDAAKAKLDAIAKNNAIAAQLVDTQVRSSITKTSKTAASPTGKLLAAAGLAGAAYSGYKKITEKKDNQKTPPGTSDIYDAVFGENKPAGTFSADVGIPEPGSIFSSSSGTFPVDTPGDFGNFNPILDDNALIDVSSANALDVLNPISFSGAEGTDLLSMGGSEALGVGEDLGGIGAIGGVGEDLGAIGGDLGAIGAIGEDFGVVEGAGLLDELGPIAIAGWVICTELKSRNLLDKTLCEKSVPHFLNLPKEVIKGYQRWAIPYVELMKNKAFGKIAIAFIQPLAHRRVLHLSGHWNFWGWLSVVIGEPICGFLGRKYG